MQKIALGLGCFWGPEESFKSKPGIIETEVGYAGGTSAKVTYEEVCTGTTGHAEVVRLTFDENIISFKKILARKYVKIGCNETINAMRVADIPLDKAKKTPPK